MKINKKNIPKNITFFIFKISIIKHVFLNYFKKTITNHTQTFPLFGPLTLYFPKVCSLLLPINLFLPNFFLFKTQRGGKRREDNLFYFILFFWKIMICRAIALLMSKFHPQPLLN